VLELNSSQLMKMRSFRLKHPINFSAISKSV
jgi:hypothetical protein